jgi:hypothetical protein
MNENTWLICLCFRNGASAKSVGSKIVIRVLNPYEVRTVEALIGGEEAATRSGTVLEFLFGRDFREIRRIDWFGERRRAEDKESATYIARTWLRHLERERRPGLIEYPRHENHPLPAHKQVAPIAVRPKQEIPSVQSDSLAHSESTDSRPTLPQSQASRERQKLTSLNENAKHAVLREWVTIIRKGLLKG